MGRGSRSRETGVKKQLEKFSKTATGSNSNNSKKDECLFSFQAILQLSTEAAAGITDGSPVTIITHHTQVNKLELFIGNKNVGVYKGSNAEKIIECIRKKYIYEGIVTKIKKIQDGKVEIEYETEGKSR